MKRRRIETLFGWMLFLFFVSAKMVMAQSSTEVALTIHLRYSDGTAVISEPVVLQRFPEEEPITPTLRQAQGENCNTDINGECTWIVGRGLYQLLFERPLDNISALAVAEGGLRGLGITVGDEDITYHFTFHSDGRVYFDAAPEAAIPSPIIPVGDVLHGGIVLSPTPSPSSQPKQPVDVTATRSPNPAAPEDAAANTTSGSSWRLILFIGGGLVIGGGLHLLRRHSGQVWSRKRQTPNRQSSIENRKSEGTDA